jgi:hypothetical protein
MKRNLILLAFLIQVVVVYAQEVDYRNYYKAINRAELRIVDSLYSDAINIYDSAFSMVAKPFGKDYHNAALCACIAGNDDKAFVYLDKLMDKGLTMDYFNKDFYKPLRNNQKWSDFSKKYDSKHDEIMKTFDLNLRRELETMQKKDQAMDMLRMSNIAQDKDSFAIFVFKNMEKLIEIINTKGFPDENKFGVIGLPHTNPVWLPFLHYIQIKGLVVNENRQKLIDKGAAPTYKIEKAGADYNKYDASAILMKASIEGKFPVHSFASMEEQKNDPVKYGCRIYLEVNGNRAYIKYSDVQTHKIDSIRNNIGLESLSDYRRKFDFFEHLSKSDARRNFFFDFQGAYWMISFADKQQGENYLNKTIEEYQKL